MPFRFPVEFERPVSITNVGNQDEARVSRRRLDLYNIDVSGGFVVPQNSVWYLQALRARFVTSALPGNRFPVIAVSEVDLDGNTIEIVRHHVATQIASLEYRVFCSPEMENSNDGTAINAVMWVAYRNIPKIPLLAGSEITFTVVGALLGDYIDANVWVNEVIV